MTNTERDWYSGDWMYLVEGKALAITAALLFGIVGAAIGILALLGFSPNRFVAGLIALVVGPAIWRRHTRHHYKVENRGN